jgi:hypothetical protein
MAAMPRLPAGSSSKKKELATDAAMVDFEEKSKASPCDRCFC